MLAEPTTVDAHATAGSVTLDIGPGRGALVIYPAPRFCGREIEISRAGETHRVHTGVHERSTHAGARLTAIFGSLPAGEYAVWADADTCATRVAVTEGTVAEIALS